jgi:hypothetical protein
MRRPLTLLAMAMVLLAGCVGVSEGESRPTPIDEPTTTGPATSARASAVKVLAVGDIATCEGSDDEQTAAIVSSRPGTVLTLGDTVYDSGTLTEFQECYAPSWGRYRSRTRPVAGNHDYVYRTARGYYQFFGSRAGQPDKGWYSFDLGRWHLVALNFNCADVGGCQAGSEQERWLRADLRQHPARCTLAYWHHPRFSSGTKHGSQEQVADLWQALYEAGADVVLSGHEHNYERFAPLDPDGRVDEATGIRQFVAGTGGRSHYPLPSALPGSQVRNDDTFGVLELTLRSASYSWRFIPVRGRFFTDAGSGRCH